MCLEKYPTNLVGHKFPKKHLALMILTTKARYAVTAIIEIAGSENCAPLSLQTISTRHDISLSYLEQIFLRLKKAGIVTSIKGPKGGYILAKKREEITMAQIIDAIGEPIKMTRCKSEKSGCLTSNAKCKTHHLWHGLESRIYDYLDSISLQNF